MLCECGEREATIHEVIIQNGKKIERHLCEKCAAKAGIDAQPHVPINELITKYIMSQPGAAPGIKAAAAAFAGGGLTAPVEVSCPTCATRFGEFKQSGLLGCPNCYKAFESRLAPLLERAHEGGSHHVGKMPRRALSDSRAGAASGRPAIESILGTLEERSERLSALRRQLAEAVEGEQYERAAKLRDEIRRITEVAGDEGAEL